jgi:hypothetical protein
MKIDVVEAQNECVSYQDCSTCLSGFGCAFVWDYAGKGMCIDESNEDEFEILKMARSLADCPPSTGRAHNPSDLGVSGMDPGMSPPYIEGRLLCMKLLCINNSMN